MSKVYTDTVTSTEASQDLTLGGSGDNVIVTAGATLKTNTVKDSGGNTLWTSDGSGNLSSVNSAFEASNLILLSTQTASNAASLSFTSSIDSTYKLYIFKFYDVNPASDGVDFSFQVNADGGSGFNETITSTCFRAYHKEDDSSHALDYSADRDQAQGTAYQNLQQSIGNGSDKSCAGELHLFNPASTTYVKHFYSRFNGLHYGDYSMGDFVGGYINTTSAIDEISFKMSSGNMDAVIKMYGVG
jgi:hypothetical protein